MNKYWQARNAETDELLVASLELAATFWTRLVGLQGRRTLPPHGGLLIAPCRSIHTCFVRFPLGILFLDQRGTVVDARDTVKPWRIASTTHDAWCVLERTAGARPIPLGTRLALVPPGATQRLPSHLACFEFRVGNLGDAAT